MNWDYSQPVKIKFGNGTIKELAEIVNSYGCNNGLLVSDAFFLQNGLADQIIEDSKGTLTTVFADISPNPDVTEVDACAAVIREKNIDFVVALGGGSAMDCAKAAASVCLTNDSIRVYHGTGVTIPEEHLPLIAVPTTSGTGSEVTCVSVLTDKENGKKAPIGSPGFYPDYAIVDPILTHSMPPHVTAGTGIDVLSHAVEGYWSNFHQPICDALAIHSIDLVLKYLFKTYENPLDFETREKMAEASVIAGLAFTLPKTTSSHACSYPLTNIYKIPHGEACGLTLDYFMRINAEDIRVKEMASKLGYESVDILADSILELKQKMGLRTNLKDFNLTDEEVADLVKISRHPNLYNNPVEITDEMLNEMYQSMR
jgi:alcohol dehydrogenase